MKKDFTAAFTAMNPDILCLQETKAQEDQTHEALAAIKGYHRFAHSAERKGYSGTAILTRQQPLSIAYGIGVAEHDTEGRVITAEYSDYFLVTVYTPNSGSELKRLDYRQTWDRAFLTFLKKLEMDKPVIVCGDFNVAHQPIDLARPKENYNQSAGYTQAEIDGMVAYVEAGFIDTFRHAKSETIKYSWWSYRAQARARNVGWRIDYFLISSTLKERILDADILNDIMGSDHCPVVLELTH